MGGDVLLGGLPGGGVFGSALWICAIMFREAEGPLERRRGASGCSLLAYTTRCERGGGVRLVYSPLLEHTTSEEGEEIEGVQAS